MLKTLPVANLIVDLSINVRLALDPATVAAYGECYDALPPVEVYELPDGRLVLVDGFHRDAARAQLGRKECQAEVVSGTWAEARERAIVANLHHGKPYTRAEKRKAVGEFLQLHPEWADNRIAQALGGVVSAPTVGRVRDEMIAAGELRPLERLVGGDGKERPRQYNQVAGEPSEPAEPRDEGVARPVDGAGPGHTLAPRYAGRAWAVYQQDIETWAAQYAGEPFHVFLGNLALPYPWSEDSAQRVAPFCELASWQAVVQHLYPGALVVVYAGANHGDMLSSLLRQAGLFLHPTIFALSADLRRDSSQELLGLLAGSADPVLSGSGKLNCERILIAQNPPSGHRATEIQTFGTGTFYIDGTRVAGAKGSGVWGSNQDSCQSGFNDSPDNAGYHSQQHPAGRQPSNLLLIHTPRCYPHGLRKVKAVSGGSISGHNAFGQGMGWNHHNNRPTSVQRYHDDEGQEMVTSWVCQTHCLSCGAEWTAAELCPCPVCGSEQVAWDCPVRRLDVQSGERPSGSWCRHLDSAHPFGHAAGVPYVRWQTVEEPAGGAARYYYNAGWQAEQTEVAHWAALSSEQRAGIACETGWHDACVCVVCGRSGTNYHISPSGRKQRCRYLVLPDSVPLETSQYLATLVLPPAIYEPRLLNWSGDAGSTAIAGVLAGYTHVATIEPDPLTAAVAQLRLRYWADALANGVGAGFHEPTEEVQSLLIGQHTR